MSASERFIALTLAWTVAGAALAGEASPERTPVGETSPESTPAQKTSLDQAPAHKTSPESAPAKQFPLHDVKEPKSSTVRPP